MPPIRRLFHYTHPYRLRIIIASLSVILNTIFDLFPDILIGIAIDIVVKKEVSFLARFGICDIHTQLFFLGCVAFVIWLLSSVTEYLYIYLWRNLGQSIQHDLRLGAYAHVQKLEMAYYEEHGTGSIVAVINDDVNQLERFFDYGAYKFIYLVTTLSVVGSTFFYFSPRIALCVLMPMGIIVGIVLWFKRQLAPRYYDIRKRVDALSNRIANNVIGMSVIKSYTSEDHELARIAQDSLDYKKANSAAIKLNAAFYPIVRIVIVIGFIATIIIGGLQVLAGTLAIGAYSVLIFQVQKILWPSSELAELADLYERAMASLRRIFALLDIPTQTMPDVQPLNQAQVKGQICFDNVHFTYKNGKPVFKGISFDIQAGSTVAFVGSTGSGKSTLIKLLLRFYEPQQGSIYVDGVDVRRLNVTDLRKVLGIVSQDVFLFPGTIYDNIVYGSFGVSKEKVIHAAKIAQAHDFIESFPDGYNTVISERGMTLSGGQRQRISIARLIVRAPSIFIFDEATSSVDHETEHAIQQALECLRGFHTILIISHRFSVMSSVDKIFVLEKGSLVQTGTHQELIAHKGLYNSLWHMQSGVQGVKSRG